MTKTAILSACAALLVLSLPSGQATAQEAASSGENGVSYVRTVEGSFDDISFAVEQAITNEGLVIDLTSHVGDMLARTGGDEFCIVLPSSTLREGAMIARRVLEVCRADAEQCTGPDIPIAVSIGVGSGAAAVIAVAATGSTLPGLASIWNARALRPSCNTSTPRNCAGASTK